MRNRIILSHREQNRAQDQRRSNGQSLVELCTALIVIIPIALLVLDGVFVFVGASLNDFVCRDAARAAAAGAPSTLSTTRLRRVARTAPPSNRASAVIKNVYYSGLPMKVRDFVDMTETVRDVPPADQGGAVDGEVTVITTIDIYPPFHVSWIGNGRVVLKSRHSMPITYVRAASTT